MTIIMNNCIIHIMADGKSENLTALPVSSKEHQLLEQLRKLTASLTPEDREATLSTLRRIFNNIIQHPNDDKYRQIKLTSKTFSSKVWQYPAGEELMKMSGWVVEDDHVRLEDGSCVQILLQLLDQKLKEESIANSAQALSCITLSKPVVEFDKRPGDQSSDLSSLLACSLPPQDRGNIIKAAFYGNASKLQGLLSQYDTCQVNKLQIDGAPIIAYAFWGRQIGIARILVNEYGVDVNTTSILKLFQGCDTSESCQSLIIQFIKEFNIDVHKSYYNFTPLHSAMMYKIFTVVKFLVEEHKVDVNCIHGSSGGTPLHMAYGMDEENIAQYLIEHGADQEAIDSNGRKPKDYQFYEKNVYRLTSKYSLKSSKIEKYIDAVYAYYRQLLDQGISDFEAIDHTFEKFPCLQDDARNFVFPSTPDQQDTNGSLVNQQLLEAKPTLNKLNPYITDMAPSYYDIGLQLDIVNSQPKLIKNDHLTFPSLKEKCYGMLEVWLNKNDTSATWKKLCDALEEQGMNFLARQIIDSIVKQQP